jgi:hypothetical protein
VEAGGGALIMAILAAISSTNQALAYADINKSETQQENTNTANTQQERSCALTLDVLPIKTSKRVYYKYKGRLSCGGEGVRGTAISFINGRVYGPQIVEFIDSSSRFI